MTVLTPPEWVEQRFARHYVEWRRRRVDAIRAHYGDPYFAGRTLLELGCGYGDVGAAFADLGALVTCCDTREEHLAVARERWPQIDTACADLNHDWPFGHFDIVLHLGLLYHLEPSHRSLRHSCRSADHLVIETEVCDDASPDAVLLAREDGYDQAIDGAGCRPSASRVERVLSEEGMAYKRVADGRCNADFHVYDWVSRDTGRFEQGQRRFWFARSTSHE